MALAMGGSIPFLRTSSAIPPDGLYISCRTMRGQVKAGPAIVCQAEKMYIHLCC
jgi:hypothetical protein